MPVPSLRATPVCGARRTGGPGTCQSTAVMRNGRCRMHGGKSLAGQASPSWKHGRYSKAVPQALRAAYEAAVLNPELLSLRDDVALVEARIAEALAGTPVSEPVGAVERAWADFKAATATGDRGKIQQAYDGVERTVAAAAALRRTFVEIERLQNLKRKLARVEHQRAFAAASMIEASAAWTLVNAILELVRTNVSDTRARRAIADGLAKVFDQRPPGGAG